MLKVHGIGRIYNKPKFQMYEKNGLLSFVLSVTNDGKSGGATFYLCNYWVDAQSPIVDRLVKNLVVYIDGNWYRKTEKRTDGSWDNINIVNIKSLRAFSDKGDEYETREATK